MNAGTVMERWWSPDHGARGRGIGTRPSKLRPETHSNGMVTLVLDVKANAVTARTLLLRWHGQVCTSIESPRLTVTRARARSSRSLVPFATETTQRASSRPRYCPPVSNRTVPTSVPRGADATLVRRPSSAPHPFPYARLQTHSCQEPSHIYTRAPAHCYPRLLRIIDQNPKLPDTAHAPVHDARVRVDQDSRAMRHKDARGMLFKLTTPESVEFNLSPFRRVISLHSVQTNVAQTPHSSLPAHIKELMRTSTMIPPG